MKCRMICGWMFISACAVGCSSASEGEKTIVTQINANRLLCTVGALIDANVVMLRPEAENLPLDKETPPSDTVTIIRAHDVERRGRRYGFIRDGTWSGDVQLGVFSDPNSALAIFEDHLLHTSVGPDKNFTAEYGTRAVGWSHRREGQDLTRILFVRENVVVSVYLALWRLMPVGVSSETTLAIAKTIDGALVNGALGVRRGKTLKVPRIVGVETVGTISERAKLTARVRVAVAENPQDKDSKEIEVVRTLPFYTPGLNPEDRAKPESKVTYHVTYITAGCVVTSKQMTVTIRPMAPSPSGDPDSD